MLHSPEQRDSTLQEHGFRSHPPRRVLRRAAFWAVVALVVTPLIHARHLRQWNKNSFLTEIPQQIFLKLEKSMCLLKKKTGRKPYQQTGQTSQRVTRYLPDLSDYWCGLFVFGHVVPFFPFPSFSNRGGWRGQRGADVSIAEALPLQDVLSVLPLQLTW